VTRRRSPRPPTRIAPPNVGDASGPGLVELERFSSVSLKRWLQAAERLNRLQASLYFDLEPLRNARSARLLAALRFAARRQYEFADWCRIVDYRYSLAPLSVAGSLKVGGRFNIGNDLEPATFTPFPALYLAESFETALREKFGRTPPSSRLSAADLALRRPTSFAQVRLRGSIDAVLDLNDVASLRGFVDVLARFKLPRRVHELARSLGLRVPGLIRTVSTLQRQLLDPNWRMVPMQYDLPSNSQVFARIAVAAGLHGILYPSTRANDAPCLALFPQNWTGSDSWIEVSDACPEGARLSRLDGTTTALM
jgi:RES domain-containing protein